MATDHLATAKNIMVVWRGEGTNTPGATQGIMAVAQTDALISIAESLKMITAALEGARNGH